MTDEELKRYHQLRKEGMTHWEALGVIYNVENP